MMRAYVLIDASLDNAGRVIGELRKKKGVLLANIVNGPHPIIALLEGDDPSKIAQTILFDIRKLEGVTDLTVYLIKEDQHKNKTVQDNIPVLSSSDKSKVVVGKARHKSRREKGRKSDD
jgi:hypothetical protein